MDAVGLSLLDKWQRDRRSRCDVDARAWDGGEGHQHLEPSGGAGYDRVAGYGRGAGGVHLVP